MTNALEQTRRETLLLGAAALVSSLAQNVEAGQDTERHGISAFGDLKYPPDFKQFDYVNPNAPRAAYSPTSGQLGPSIRTFSPSTRSTVSSLRAMVRKVWSSPSR